MQARYSITGIKIYRGSGVVHIFAGKGIADSVFLLRWLLEQDDPNG